MLLPVTTRDKRDIGQLRPRLPLEQKRQPMFFSDFAVRPPTRPAHQFKHNIITDLVEGQFPHLPLCRFAWSDKRFLSAALRRLRIQSVWGKAEKQQNKIKQNKAKTQRPPSDARPRWRRPAMQCSALCHFVRWLSLRCDYTHGSDLARLWWPGVHLTNNRATTSLAQSSLITIAARQGHCHAASKPLQPPPISPALSDL